LKIAIVLPGGVDKSGTERVVPALLWLIERLAKQHTVKIVALHQYPDPCRYDLLGAEVINLGAVKGRVNELKMPARLRQLNRALGGFKPHVIHAIGAQESGVLAGVWGRWHKIPVVVSIWSGELVWLPKISYGWQGNWRTRLPISIAQRLATAITGGSRYTQSQSPYPMHWLPLGVDTNLFHPSTNPKQADVLRLVHVAHVNGVKDQQTLLKAVRLVADQVAVRLDWFGEDMGGRVPAFLRTHNLENIVHFHGIQPIDSLLPFYQQAHLMVQSSLHESQGVAVCEAAACGIPTVGTAVGLVAELSPNMATAVPSGDPSALAEAILQVWHHPDKRQAMGQAVKQWAIAHNADWTAHQFELMYSTLSS
jgi:glycosyltransferase involved in cell wall biosynthesis